MASPIVTGLSLCSGIGMLDEAVRFGCEYFGWRYRVLGYAERDAYAAATLLARMGESSLEPAPVWCDDIARLDAKPLRGLVGIFSAGLPCQPYSVAGKQAGLSDARSYGDGDGPIPHALRIIAECQPAVVFLENVPPWVSGGWFRPVGEELCRLGYTVESPLFVTAEAVGASHRRERVFVLAHTGRQRLWQRNERGDSGCQSSQPESRIQRTKRKRGGKATGDRVSAMGNAAQSGQQAIRERLNPAGQGIVGSRSGTVEYPGSERRGEAGELSSGGNARFAVGELVHAEHGRQDIKESRAELGGAGGANGVVNTSRKRRTKGNKSIQRSRDKQARRKADDAIEGRSDLGNANGSGRRQQGDASDQGGVAPSSGSLADAQQPRPQGDGLGKQERGMLPIPCDTNGRVFAPGPQCDWQQISEALYPAIEPGLCVLVDGVAVVVDESRADQLRCGGNGVVATAAAVAFVELMRRII